MATIIKSTDLDHADIKSRLVEFMKRQEEFQDYDFEASGLSVITDVLAYNTHQNALIANMALGEQFIQTAQLRSSLVNLAMNYAYVPRSRTSSVAYLNVSVNLTASATKPAEISLPAGTVFTTTLDEVEYTFRTQEEYIAEIDAAGLGIYTFKDENANLYIPVREGIEKTKTFITDVSDGRQVYVIPDDTLDLNTLQVRVYENNSDTVGVSYLSSSTLTSTINEDTKIFIPLETYNGFYELNFGDGVITGDAPKAGNIIKAKYISSSGRAANGADVFNPSQTISVDGVSYNLNVSTVSKSALGGDKESTESIRINAPLNYLAQRRLVTPLDYVAVISNSFPGIKSMNAWGGEDNEPEPKFGKVLISIIYEDDIDDTAKQQLQDRIIKEVTNPLSITSITGEIVEPDYTYLELKTNMKYNTGITSLSKRGIEDKVKGVISTWFSDNMGRFNDVFRKSKLLSVVDASDASILSSDIQVRMQQRFTPIFDSASLRFIRADYTLNFLNTIKEPTKETPVITSDGFIFKGKVASIRNRVGDDFSTTLEVIDTDGNVMVSDAGYFKPSTGQVVLTAFSPTSISSGNSYLKISATPNNDNNIKPLRNHVIDISVNVVNAEADIDVAENTVGVSE